MDQSLYRQAEPSKDPDHTVAIVVRRDLNRRVGTRDGGHPGAITDSCAKGSPICSRLSARIGRLASPPVLELVGVPRVKSALAPQETTKATTDIPNTNPIKRLNKEVKSRSDVVGIFSNGATIIRLVGAVLLEQNDEWQTQNRYMQTEPMAEFAPPTADVVPPQIATVAA